MVNAAGKQIIGHAVARMDSELDELHILRAELLGQLARLDTRVEGLCVARDTLQENLEGDD